MLTCKNKEFRWYYLEYFGMKSEPQFFASNAFKNYDVMLGINNKHLSTKSHNFISNGHPQQFSLVLKSTYFVEKIVFITLML